MLPGLHSNASRQAAGLRLAYSAPEPDNSTIEELRRLTSPATKALPFVRLRANDQPLWRPEGYWQVRSTGKRGMDVELGRTYARTAIAAMKADHNAALIALILQDIIHDAAQRGGKNGRGRISHVATGFLDEISRSLAVGTETGEA
jgi:hypothetical protein